MIRDGSEVPSMVMHFDRMQTGSYGSRIVEPVVLRASRSRWA